MNALSLDISTASLGWAYGDGTIQNTIYGTKSFSLFKDDYGSLFFHYEKWLNEIIEYYQPQYLFLENVNPGLKGQARYLLTAMHGIAHKNAWYEDLMRIDFSPPTIKKFFTTNGRASKEDMVAQAESRGFLVDNNDEADAIAILLLGLETVSEGEWKPTEKK